MGENGKKLCYVNPGINIRRPISSIMNLLKKKNYTISLLTPRKKIDRYRQETRHYDDFEGINLLTYPIWTKASGFIWPIPTNLEFFRKSWKILKESDIIHVWVPFYPNTFIFCILKLLFFKRKTLVLTMDTFPAYSFKVSSILDVFFRLYFKTIAKLSFLASKFIIIYGNSFIKHAIKAGVPKRKIRVTPTGINLTLKKPDKNIRKIFKIDSNESIILFVGLHNKRKGLDTIIKTANLLKNEDVRFICVGDGPERLNSIDQASKLGLEEKIIFVGNRLDVHNFYGQAEIFFLPSRGEGLAGVLMEAMVYQVPIVSSNIAGTRDLIKHMDNGILCEVDNYKCYARHIKMLLHNDELKAKFRKNGLIAIKSNYLWKNNIKRFQSIYNS